jgi:hypothetical protein
MFDRSLAEDSPRETPEKRLWKAVIAKTVQEWISGPLSRQRVAEEFLLRDAKDFPLVCQSAGMDPGRLRTKLIQLKKSINDPGQLDRARKSASRCSGPRRS